MTQTATPATGRKEIDLAVVREIMSHFHPQDYQEAQELILSALQEINEHFGWVSLEAAEIVAGELLCKDREGRVIARFAASGRVFGRLEVLALLSAALKRHGQPNDGPPLNGAAA